MVTPIESNVSIFNVDHMANQVRDPNATHVMGAQQIDVKRESEQMSQTVQRQEETDAFVRVGDQERERERGGSGKKQRESGGQEDQEEPIVATNGAGGEQNGFSLIA